MHCHIDPRFSDYLFADALQPRISSVATTARNATVQWNALSTTLDVIAYDILVVRQSGNIAQNISLVAGRGQYPSYQVEGLTPETVYSFQVRARTEESTSQWSTPFVKNTPPDG